MTDRLYRVPYSKSFLEFSLPAGFHVDVAVSQDKGILADPQAAIQEALDFPVGSPPLIQLAKPGMKACIVFTDTTRASPDHLLVPPILRQLEAAGVHDEDVTLLCGTGMHRPSTPTEKVAKLGAEIVNRYRVIDNEPQNLNMLVDLGITPAGVPVQANRAAIEADLLIATGIVEPHQYAGYSGGSKTLAVGAAGEALIAHTHGPAFVDDPCTRLGKNDGNPYQEAVTEAARRAGLRFIVNVVLDDEKHILMVKAGDPILAYRELVAFARSVYEVSIPYQYDIVIGGVGYPKDSNIYQASRAPSYLYFAPTPVACPGGMYIIPARCEEGAGIGVGEQRFWKAMKEAADVLSILEDARQHGYPPGQQRAFVLAKVLEHNRVIIVGSECPELVADCKMTPAASMDTALAMAVGELGSVCKVLIVPHALLTLPVVEKVNG
ncbi:MAG: nickel-dependent lactate racemase [Anaerolineae bacterium]|nr:nickel-dependent lactate racemase [Anaerolineae bacterium]